MLEQTQNDFAARIVEKEVKPYFFVASSVQAQVETFYEISQDDATTIELALTSTTDVGGRNWEECGKNEKFKQRECVIWTKNRECPNGLDCKYAHGQLELITPANLSQNEALEWFS